MVVVLGLLVGGVVVLLGLRVALSVVVLLGLRVVEGWVVCSQPGSP